MELEKLISKKGNYGGTNKADDIYFGCSKAELQHLVSDGKIENNFEDLDHICSALKTSAKSGLNPNNREDLDKRISAFGSNKLEAKESRMFLWFVWEAIQDQTLIILIIAALVSIALAIYEESHKAANAENQFEEAESGLVEGVGIMVAVVMVVAATAGINYNREKQFRNLQMKLNEQIKCCVIRDGSVVEIPTFEVLVGDICIIRAGDVIPADGISLKSTELKVDESSHTGESDEVLKIEASILYSGTHVIEGTCKMLVLAVGESSQQGVIFSLLKISYDDVNKSEDKRSILHSKLCKITNYVTIAGTTLAVITFLVLLTRYCVIKFAIEHKVWGLDDLQSIINFIIISITLLVVAIPEGLPLAVILALAYSIKKMMRDSNLVRHLDSCETMGSATIICSDKTGTLTTNRMAVATCFIAGMKGRADEMKDGLSVKMKEKVARCISVNSTASTSMDGFSPMGSKTECALLNFVSLLGFSSKDLQEEEKQIKVYSFNSKRKWMATVVEVGGGDFLLMVKGAPEIILKRSTRCVDDGDVICPLTPERKDGLMKETVDKMATSGLRTMCLAYKEFKDSDLNWNDEDAIVNDLTCLAIIGIEDPVREEVPEAIRNCRSAGIEVCMVSGDHLLTAKFVAEKCGLLREGDSEALAMSGEEFNRNIKDENGEFDQTRFDLIWPKLKVLARASPQDKFVLVSGLMSSNINNRKQVVAVTGDGTNDAPALKKAHVGLCMGISGTDVAKEASDIILLDDNFTNIVKSVVWGRHVHDSIAKFIQFQLTINIVSVIMVVMGAAILTDSPLRGVQMLWVNLLMDTLASLSLATEDPSEDLLHRKPYCSKKSLISSIMLTNIVCHAIFQLTILSAILWKGFDWMDLEPGFSDVMYGKPNVHYTFLFNSFVMMILFNEINSRKIDASLNVFSGLLKSPAFVIIWVLSFVIQIALVQVGGKIFFTTSLNFALWLWCIFIGITELLFAQVVSMFIGMVKWIRQMRSKKHYVERIQ